MNTSEELAIGHSVSNEGCGGGWDVKCEFFVTIRTPSIGVSTHVRLSKGKRNYQPGRW
jgi:hypothetical protein